jgi:hypothetical protein
MSKKINTDENTIYRRNFHRMNELDRVTFPFNYKFDIKSYYKQTPYQLI